MTDNMKNYEDKMVQDSFCDPKWPIGIYEFLYKDKIKNHFSFRTSQIDIVEDYFGDENGQNMIVDSKEASVETILYNSTRDQYHNLLIERGSHIGMIDDFEKKFKALYKSSIIEFFLSVLHLSADDPFDELIEGKDKINGFIDICDALIEKHNIDINVQNRPYSVANMSKNKQEATFFDEISHYASDEEAKDMEEEVKLSKSKSGQPKLSQNLKIKTANQKESGLRLNRVMTMKAAKSGFLRGSKSFIDKLSSKDLEFDSIDDNQSDSNSISKCSHNTLTRMKSSKLGQNRKIMSAAQLSKIEHRFNHLKVEKKHKKEQKLRLKKMGSRQIKMLDIKNNPIDLMNIESFPFGS